MTATGYRLSIKSGVETSFWKIIDYLDSWISQLVDLIACTFASVKLYVLRCAVTLKNMPLTDTEY